MADTNINVNLTAKDKASASIQKLSGKFGPLNKKAGKFDKTMGKADKSIKKSTKSMNKMKLAMGAAAVAAGAFAAVKVVGAKIDEFDALAKSARAAGSATSNEAFEGFQVLQKAMGEAGVEAGVFNLGMLQTSNRLQKGIEGQKSFAKITDKLGSSIRKSNGELKSGPELMKAMINGLNNGTISTEEFAKVVGGKAGPVIQAQFASLNKSAEALEATLADVKGNSDIVSLKAANNAEAFNDKVGRLKEGMGSLMTKAITPMIPILIKLVDGVMANMPAIMEKVSFAFKTIGDVLGPLAKVLFPLLKAAFQTIGWVIKNVTFPIFKLLIGIVTNVANVISGFVDGIVKAFNAIKEFGGKIKNFFGFGGKDEEVNVTTNLTEKVKKVEQKFGKKNKVTDDQASISSGSLLKTAALSSSNNATVNNYFNIKPTLQTGTDISPADQIKLIEGLSYQQASIAIRDNLRYGGLA